MAEDMVEEIEKAKIGVEKAKSKIDELKEKYGVTSGIPMKRIETEEVKREVERREEMRREESVPELLMRIEKIDGKLDLMNNFRIGTEERMTDFSEKIGEMRSSFLSLEKRFTSIETEAESALELIKEVNPISIKKEIESREQEILELRAELEKHKEFLEELQKQGSEVKNVLNQIGNIENILKASRRVGDKLAVLDESKSYVDRTATKIEAIFSELSEDLKDIELQKDKVRKLNELSIDIAKTLDELSIKVSKSVSEDKLNDILGEKLKGVGRVVVEGKPGVELASINELNQKYAYLKEDLNRVVSLVMQLADELQKLQKVVGDASDSTTAGNEVA